MLGRDKPPAREIDLYNPGFGVKNIQEWQRFVEANSHSQIAMSTILLANVWVRNMERKMISGSRAIDIANDTYFETAKMVGAPDEIDINITGILSEFWIHGDVMFQWIDNKWS